MVAVVRGRASSSPKTRPRAPAKAPQKAAARTNKFRGSSDGAGLPPRLALIAASGAVALCAGVILFTGDRLERAGQSVQGAVADTFAGMGFSIRSLQVAGAAPPAAAAVAAATGLSSGDPILGVDLEAIREKVEQVGWVRSASVIRLLPDTIKVQVVEREPVAVWQMDGRMRVIDADGQIIREADPAKFADLPLVVGAGANETGGEIFELIKARPRLVERLEAMVRVDGRRWDLRLKDGSIIQLPAVGEDQALIGLDKLDQGQGLLDLGFERIDLRSADMVVVRRRDNSTSTPMTLGAL